MPGLKKPVPKYFQIMQQIAAQIRRGDLPPAAAIPSENELIEAYRISNTTARRIHQELERSGLVDRIKGKGTYVRDGQVDRSLDRILGFSKNMIEAGRVPSTRVISVTVRRLRHAAVVNGRRYVLPGPVCEIKRLRLADGVAMMRETRYVSEAICPEIHKRDLEGSLYDIYERDYGLQLVRVEQRLSAIILDGEESGFPGVAGAIPAFVVEGVTFCGKELLLETEESIYRGDMYRFAVRATREVGGAS